MPQRELFFRRKDRPPLFIPGDPGSTEYVDALWRIANAAASLPKDQAPTRMFLTATNYAAVIAEFRAQYENVPKDNPGYLIFGKANEFRVINAGTDDQETVNRMNRDTPGAVDFEARVRRFK